MRSSVCGCTIVPSMHSRLPLITVSFAIVVLIGTFIFDQYINSLQSIPTEEGQSKEQKLVAAVKHASGKKDNWEIYNTVSESADLIARLAGDLSVLVEDSKKTSLNSDSLKKVKLARAIASERKKKALDLMKSDPLLFSKKAVKKDVWKNLPPEIQKDVEEEVTLTGTLQVIHVDDFEDGGKSDFIYKLKSNGKEYNLYLSKKRPLMSGTEIRVQGFLLDNILADAGGAGEIQIMADAPAVEAVGNQRILVLLLTPSSTLTLPFTRSQAEGFAFSGQFANFMREQSYNKVSFSGDVYDWIVYPDASSCTILDAPTLGNIASSKGIDLSLYDRIVYFINGSYGGCSTIGKSDYFINGFHYRFSQASVSALGSQINTVMPFSWTSLDSTLSHEIGHSLGVMHANGWDCDSSILYGYCNHVEYGNPFDVMGTRYVSLNFNALYKESLGWLEPSRILTITNSGTYTINNLESPTGIASVKIKTLDGLSTPFIVERRRPIGFDAGIGANDYKNNSNGLLINKIVDDYFPFPRLLDMSPVAGAWRIDALNAALTGSQVFHDEGTGISVGPIRSVSDTAVSFDVSVATPTCVRLVPQQINATPFSTRSVRGSLYPITYSVNALNGDIGCGDSRFRIGVISPVGWGMSPFFETELVSTGERALGSASLLIPSTISLGTYLVVIEVSNNQSGLSTTISVQLEVVDPPRLDSLNPASGPGGTSVILSGKNFYADSTGNVTVNFRGASGFGSIVGSFTNNTTATFNIPTTVTVCDADCREVATPDGLYDISIVGVGGTVSNTLSFEVKPLPLTVIYPNGGEKWQVGETYTIQYDLPTPSHKALIYLQQYHPEGSTKTGVNSSRLIGEPAVGVKSFSYKVDDPAAFGLDSGDRFKISVCASTCALRDSSDGFFSIVNQGVASLTRVGADNQPSSAPAGTTATLETTTIALNTARFYGLDSTTAHKAYFTDLPGYTETAGACNYAVGSSECTVTDYTTLPLCNGSTCFVGFSVTDCMVTKINTRYIAGSFTRISSQSTDYTSVGIGMGTTNSGSIKLSGISGTVKKALLIWNSVGNLTSAPTQNVTVTKLSVVPDGSSNTITLTGNNLGTSGPNNTGTKYSRTYVADISSFVRSNGDYQVSDFGQSSSLNPDGASLIVLFDDGNNANNRSITLVACNDSNCSNTRDASGWNVAVSNVMYVSGTANLEIHAGDGQST